MPFYRKRHYVNRHRKYANRRSHTTTVDRSPGLIGDRFITKLKYAEQQNITTTVADTPAGIIYNLNSIFDPDRTNIGHQPMGFDQYSVFYQRYRVFKCRWQIRFRPNTTAGSGTIFVIPNNSTTSFNGQQSSLLMETPRAIFKEISADNPVTISGSISLPHLAGVSSAVYKADPNYQALVSANPAEALCLHVQCSSPVALTLRYDILLEFYTEFYDPLPVPQS